MSNSKENDKLRKLELQKKYSEKGFDALSQTEVIELLLAYCSRKDFTLSAEKLLEQYGSLTALLDSDINALRCLSEIDDQTIVLLKLITHLSKKYSISSNEITVLNSSDAAKRFFESHFIGAFDEKLMVVCTDKHFSHIVFKFLFTGSTSLVKISCREIANFALLNDSERVFIAHNHPVSDATPSADDFNTTNLIFRTLNQLGIVLIDHIIVGIDETVSMRELPYSMQFKSADSFGYIFEEKKNKALLK
jgi:DNA repair protein RadC